MNRKTIYISLLIAVLIASLCLTGCQSAQGQQPPADDPQQAQSEVVQNNTDSGQAGQTADSGDAQETDEPSTQVADGQDETGQTDQTQEPETAGDTQEEIPKDDGSAQQAPQEQTPSQEHPTPTEPQDAVVTDIALTCTISIDCATILNNVDKLNPEKVELLPADGVILPATEVTFYEGESVFNVLQRVCKQNKIHMEFMNTPVYNSAYIEGIHNLYEFDCGELSGWMYSVNGWFPNYGCSRYALKDGDVIAWRYTCDLGEDVGGAYFKDE